MISFAKPTAPVAVSEIRLNINTSTVPSIILNTESMKMGQVTAKRLSFFHEGIRSVIVTLNKLLLDVFFVASPSVAPTDKYVYWSFLWCSRIDE